MISFWVVPLVPLMHATSCRLMSLHTVRANPSLGTRLLASYMKMISRKHGMFPRQTVLRADAISGEENCWDMLRYKAAPRDFSSAGWNHDNHMYVECWGISFVMFRHVSSNLWWNQTAHFSVASQGPATWVKHPCDAPAKDSTVMVEVAHTSTTSPTVSLSVLLSTSVQV